MAGVPGQSGAGGQATAGGTEHKGPGTGVLITGCQSNETSADACPSGDPSKAFGALTNALTTIVQAQKSQNPQARASLRCFLCSGRRSAVVSIKQHARRNGRFAARGECAC